MSENQTDLQANAQTTAELLQLVLETIERQHAKMQKVVTKTLKTKN